MTTNMTTTCESCGGDHDLENCPDVVPRFSFSKLSDEDLRNVQKTMASEVQISLIPTLGKLSAQLTTLQSSNDDIRGTVHEFKPNSNPSDPLLQKIGEISDRLAETQSTGKLTEENLGKFRAAFTANVNGHTVPMQTKLGELDMQMKLLQSSNDGILDSLQVGVSSKLETHVAPVLAKLGDLQCQVSALTDLMQNYFSSMHIIHAIMV
jgi:hypothetical protein